MRPLLRAIVLEDGACRPSANVDLALVDKLTTGSPIPCTYAGGANSIADLEAVHTVSNGSVHLTIGSALDIFGGTVKYDDCIAFNLQHSS